MGSGEDWIGAVVCKTQDLTSGIREITLRPERGAQRYPSGAHIKVRVLIDGKPHSRHYSLVGDGPFEDCWRIAVKLESNGHGGSKYMWSLSPGDKLTITKPGSYFELSHNAPDYLLIAGGIGITPIRGMATTLLKRGATFKLVYAGRSRSEMAYLNELISELGGQLDVVTDDSGAAIDLDKAIGGLSARGEVYVCGPLGLLEAVKRMWAETARPRENLVFETFASSGRFASHDFTVKVPRLGIEVLVPSETSMLDALESFGISVLSDCRRGECGVCAMKVLEVQGDIDHRDVFFSEREHAENHRVCACVSRVAGGVIVVDPALRDDVPLR
jgi:ferredoxin-NADP reductase